MWLEIGTIVSPQGLRGEVRVYPSSDFPERFIEPGQRWLLTPGASEPQPIELLQGRFLEGKGLYVVQLQGINTREQAEALRHSQLLAPESDRPPLEPDEFHVADLVGLNVILQATQTAIGKVVGVYQAGNDLLEVAMDQPQATAEIPPIPSKSSPDTQDALQKSSQQKSSKRSKKRKRTKQNDKLTDPPTVLIPFVKEIVPVVDLAQGRLEIIPPPGLIEL
ncbi:MAG: ribosome maturation factor RimM [Leptolyngbyaceae cyanobacterium MO_188.B28]|nr:ribosome maturation factor RimM [Leptolyngbyaceae cyanobacterium MO_188.B28]